MPAKTFSGFNPVLTGERCQFCGSCAIDRYEHKGNEVEPGTGTYVLCRKCGRLNID